MDLKIIGAGDAFGSEGNLNTCFHLQHEHLQILIDCGATSLVGLKKNQIEPAEIDYILISHLHGDHFGGLPFFLLDLLRKNRKKTLTIIGPKGIEENTLALLELLYPGLQAYLDLSLIIFKTYQAHEELETEFFKLQAFPVVHSEESLPHGLKLFIDDKIIAFSGDTEWTDNLIELSKAADLFICECNFFEKRGKGHLNYKTILQHQEALECKHILLSHLGEEALNHLDLMTIPVAKDGMEITI
ncbi:MAG: MBL fold metallo-hydrolase [Sphingobacteriales bacterium]|nr:MBL fold metallo-hydrolase [Sphingobacteriales bacterium]